MVKPLVHYRPNNSLAQLIPDTASQGNEHTTMNSMATQYPPARIDDSTTSLLVQEGGIDLPDKDTVSQDRLVAPDDDLLWDLIDSQPWLGWMRSDALTNNSTSN